ncbi:MAG: hypothetical protein LIP02_13890 [Bacteroidales bacterium]|nr:hypothetical protein [Bacteroidales bacterium]
MDQDLNKYHLPNGFKTSIDVLKQVMNVPEHILEHELYKNGYSTSNSSSNCIDEKMLERFWILFNKRLKRWFTSTIEAWTELSVQDADDFRSFCGLYCRNGHITSSWRKIDKEKLKEDFFVQIYNATKPEQKYRITSGLLYEVIKCGLRTRQVSPQVLDDIISFSSRSCPLESNYDYVTNLPFKETIGGPDRPTILQRITKNRRYQFNVQKRQVVKPLSPPVHRLFLYAYARYHVFSNDGKDEPAAFMSRVS